MKCRSFFLFYFLLLWNFNLIFSFSFPNILSANITVNGISSLSYEALSGETVYIKCKLDKFLNVSNVAIYDNSSRVLNSSINFVDNSVSVVIHNITNNYNGWFRCRDTHTHELLSSCKVIVGDAVNAPSVTCALLNLNELTCTISPKFSGILKNTGFNDVGHLFDIFSSRSYDFGNGFIKACEKCESVTDEVITFYPELANITIGSKININITVCIGVSSETPKFCSPSIIESLTTSSIVKPPTVAIKVVGNATDNCVNLTIGLNLVNCVVYTRSKIDGSMLTSTIFNENGLILRNLLPGTLYIVEIALRYKERSLNFIKDGSDNAVGLLSEWSEPVTFHTNERRPLALRYVGIQRQSTYSQIYWQLPPLEELGGALLQVRSRAVEIDGSYGLPSSSNNFSVIIDSADKKISGVVIDLKNSIDFGAPFLFNFSSLNPELDLADVDVSLLENRSYTARIRFSSATFKISKTPKVVFLWACLAVSLPQIPPCNQPINMQTMNISGITVGGSTVLLNLPPSFFINSNNRVYFAVSWSDGVSDSLMSPWNDCIFTNVSLAKPGIELISSTTECSFSSQSCLVNTTVNLFGCTKSSKLMAYFRIQTFVELDKSFAPVLSSTYVLNSTQQTFDWIFNVPFFKNIFTNLTVVYVDGEVYVLTNQSNVGSNGLPLVWHVVLIGIIFIGIIISFVYRCVFHKKNFIYYCHTMKRLKASDSHAYKVRTGCVTEEVLPCDSYPASVPTKATSLNIDSSASYSNPVLDVAASNIVAFTNPLPARFVLSKSPQSSCSVDMPPSSDFPIFCDGTTSSTAAASAAGPYSPLSSQDSTGSEFNHPYAKVTLGNLASDGKVEAQKFKPVANNDIVIHTQVHN